MRILFVNTFYSEYLDELYATKPQLRGLDFDRQLLQIMDTGFCLADAYSANRTIVIRPTFR